MKYTINNLRILMERGIAEAYVNHNNAINTFMFAWCS